MRRTLTFSRNHCLTCGACELACAVGHSASGKLAEAIRESPSPRSRVDLLPTAEGIHAQRCAQCDEPLCAYSCKTGALHRDPKDGRVLFEPDKCVGCFMCLMVCPDGVRPDSEAKRVVRCDACADRETPECVAACPTGAIDYTEKELPRKTTDFTGHVVVVGASAAGIAACESAREHAPGAAITLVTTDKVQGYSRPMLPYLLARKIPTAGMYWRGSGLLEDLNVKVIQGAAAVGVDPKAKRLLLDVTDSPRYDKLIIATGARPVMPDIEGAGMPGVYGLRNLEDLAEIEKRIEQGGKAVVMGGGNVGLQTCEALLSRGMGAAVVVRSPHLLSQMVDEEAGRRVGELFERHGLVLRTGRDVKRILGEDEAEQVELDDGETLPANLVIVGKGIRPNVEWLKGSPIKIGRGVAVDLCGRTSAPDVFAAGDCAEMADNLTGQTGVSGIWPVAYEMGRAAGATAVGAEFSTAGALYMNASRFFGTPVISIGEVRERKLKGARVRVLADWASGYRKIVHRDGRLCGAVLYGQVAGAGTLYRLYRDGIKVGDDVLEKLEDNTLEQVLKPFVPAGSEAGRTKCPS